MTLQALFDWVLQASVAAAVLVPAILLLKFLLKERMDARWHYLAWLLLLARLLLPFAPESSLSVFNAVPVHGITIPDNAGPEGDYSPPPVSSPPPADQGDIHDPADGPHAGEPPEAAASVPAEPAEGQPPGGPGAGGESAGRAGGQLSGRMGIGGTGILPLAWLAGAAALAVHMLLLNGRLWGKYRKAAPCADPHLTAVVSACRRKLGVKRDPVVIVSPEIKSPALFGFLRPKLLLPAGLAGNLKGDELRHIILHELAHLKRADIAVYWLTGLLQVLHWFNPLIWYAFYRMRQDSEMACDALVLSRFSPAERAGYGHTMIKLAAAGGGSHPALLPGLAGIVEEESQIKRRIIMISRFKKSTLALTAAGIILLAALAVFFLTGPRGPASFELATPSQMIIFDQEKSVLLEPGSGDFMAIWKAAREAVQSGKFDFSAVVEASHDDIAAYAAAEKTIVLAIGFERPVKFDFTGERVRRLYIDVNNAWLLTSGVDDGSYNAYVYALAKLEGLREALRLLLPAALHLVVEADPAEGGRVAGSGLYREGEEAAVEAMPAEGYVFAGWKAGGNLISFDRKYKFAVDPSEFGEAVFAGTIKLVAVFEKVEGISFNRHGFSLEWATIPKLSPDERRLLGLRDGDLLLYKFPDQVLLNTFAADQCRVMEFHWHPRGEAFAYIAESGDRVCLNLVKLNGDEKNIITFDRAKHDPDWISLDGMDYRVGWLSWALQGEAVALQRRSEEATRLLLVSLDGKILLEETIEEPYVFLRDPLVSGDGRQIALTLVRESGENLWVWDLNEGGLRQVTRDGEGDYPFRWLNPTALMVKVGAGGTGGGNVYGTAVVDLKTGSRRMVDHQTGRLNVAQSMSPGERYLLVESGTHDGDNRIYLLDLQSGRREVIQESYGTMLLQALWLTEKEALITTRREYEDKYEDIYSIQHFAMGDMAVPLMQNQWPLHILGIRDGVLHYLLSNKNESHWFWKTQALPD